MNEQSQSAGIVKKMVCNGKHTWSQEAHDNLLKRLDETAKKPTSYARKKSNYDAMTDDFVRY